MTLRRLEVIGFLAVWLSTVALPHYAGAIPSLTHRYSFDANANDSVGTAHGVLLGDAVITNGSALLNGGYIQLPANLCTNSKSLTIEAWVKVPSGSSYAVWNFAGSPSIACEVLEWNAWTYYGSRFTANSTVTSVAPVRDELTHLVWSQDFDSQTARIYMNGVLSGENKGFTANPGPTTASSYIGRGMAPFLKGSILEFRIHSNAFSHLEVLLSGAAGPDAFPASPVALTNLSLRLPSHVPFHSRTPPRLIAGVSGHAPMDISPLSDIELVSNDTNVIEIMSDGYVRAVGFGQADIVANYRGLGATSTVTVVDASHFSLKHRYDFGGRIGSTNLFDLTGNGAHARSKNGTVITNTTHLYFDGANNYAELPAGILSDKGEVTIESWIVAHKVNSKNWSRVFEFGSNSTYFVLAPSAAQDSLTTDQQFIRFTVVTNGSIGTAVRLTAKPWVLDGSAAHLAVTYSPPRNASRLFVNGVLADSGEAQVPLNEFPDATNWLGRARPGFGDLFNGLMDEFRIYNRVLEPTEIAASFAMGPDVIGVDYILRAQALNGNIVLSWGPWASWLRLETASDLAGQEAWVHADVEPVFSNDRLEVSVPVSDTPQFFRLAPP